MKGVRRYKFFTSSTAAWKAMYAAIEKAQKSIYWESYIFLNDTVGVPFITLLIQKAKVGVEVKLIFDSWGSFRLSADTVAQLRTAGIDILLFNDVTPWRAIRWFRSILQRTHRKLLVIDNEIGFIGGVNIDERSRHWMDLVLMIRGKLVTTFTHSFARSYVAGGGEKKAVEHLLIEEGIRNRLYQFIFHHPRGNRSRIRRSFIMMIDQAKQSILLVTPYYVPDIHFLRSIRRAIKRGVKVEMIFPLRGDIALLTYATRAYFFITHTYGVAIHLLRNMVHAKAIVVDGEHAMVGSGNLDRQSFYFNHEANLQFRHKSMVRDLKKILEKWKSKAEQLNVEVWKKRGWKSRIMERLARWLDFIL